MNLNNLNIYEILKYGVIGLSSFLALLCYFLIYIEQRREEPRAEIIRMINIFMFFSVVLSIVSISKEAMQYFSKEGSDIKCKEEVTELRSKNSDYESKIKVLNQQLSEKKDSLARLQDECKSVSNCDEKCKKEVESRSKEYEDKIKGLNFQIADLRNRLNESGNGGVIPSPPPPVEEQIGFKFELQRCERNGKSIYCHFLITSIDKDKHLNIYTRETKIVDDLGNVYLVARMKLGSDDSAGSVRNLLIADIPVKSVIVFENFSLDAKKIRLLTLQLDSSLVSFRNINFAK